MVAPKTVMLVDDDPDDQYLFTHALSEIFPSITCVCVDNAEQAIEGLQKQSLQSFDYLFLDLNLPLMDGLTFLRFLKEKKDLQDIPVVIYSTSSRPTDKERAKELGAQGYIQKPSTFNELIELMQKVFPTI